MFESAELGHEIDKKQYQRLLPAVRNGLLQAQYELLDRKSFPLILVIAGVDGAGKGETVNVLSEWMDPRHIQVHAIPMTHDEEAVYPRMRRFWLDLPPKGKMGTFFGSWYTDPIIQRVYRNISKRELELRTSEINAFEQLLVSDGALLVKFWFHLSKKEQKKRLEDLEGDPRTRWRVTKLDWKHFGLYDRFRKVSESVLRETSTGEAPWIVVEGTDERYRSLTVGKVLLDLMRKRLDEGPGPARKAIVPPEIPAIDHKVVLDTLDLTQTISKKKYDNRLEELSGRLNLLSREAKFKKRAAVIVFEGMDAAGKGGAIRRVTRALDARSYQTVAISAPTEDERAQPYLWRFWKGIPPACGRIVIFDRSWYGRVLVERIMGYAKDDEWMRAYTEINDFEEQLVKGGISVIKLWLHITKEEQLKRFKERQRTSFKRFKITKEDWRNRKHWNEYVISASDMIDRTSTDIAPWTIIPANDKHIARLEVMEAIVRSLERVV
jgi:polyphosphate:AMP phosphotransferase